MKFYSSVILNSTETQVSHKSLNHLFYSSVILNSTETNTSSLTRRSLVLQ